MGENDRGWNDQYFSSIGTTADGGYILGGLSNSPISGDKTENPRGGPNDYDYWIVKLDASGNIEWDKTLGGEQEDALFSIIQTNDGGYIAAGYSYSNASFDKTENLRGDNGAEDFWIVKIDSRGRKLWDKTVGGIYRDYPNSIRQTEDGGYIVGGSSDSPASFEKSEDTKGSNSTDFWLVKLDAMGRKEWDKTLGGNDTESFSWLNTTTDGGFIICGSSDSRASFDKSENSRGEMDYWIVKTDAFGNKQWDKTIGGSSRDICEYVAQTLDGGFIAGGTSNSSASEDKTENSRGAFDYWVVKITDSGEREWDKTLGGSGTENFKTILQSPDLGYILAGDSDSEASGDKTEPSMGGGDFWLVKLASPASPVGKVRLLNTNVDTIAENLDNIPAVYPNPVKSSFQVKNLDGEGIVDIKIMSLSGKKVGEYKCDSRLNSDLNLPASINKSGIYILSITQDNSSPQYMKIAVER